MELLQVTSDKIFEKEYISPNSIQIFPNIARICPNITQIMPEFGALAKWGGGGGEIPVCCSPVSFRKTAIWRGKQYNLIMKINKTNFQTKYLELSHYCLYYIIYFSW